MNRRERTTASLRHAAIELFQRHGYETTTTARVAERAGVSEMTLFRHFASKEALLLSDPFDPAMAAAVADRPPGEAAMPAVAEGIRTAWRRVPPQEVARLLPVLRIAARAPSLAGALERNSSGTCQALAGALVGRGVEPATARVVAAAAIAGLSQALLGWAIAERDEPDDEPAAPAGLTAAIEGALDALAGR